MQSTSVSREDENDSEVRREDQDNINRFARLNARLHQVRQEKKLLQVRKLFIFFLFTFLVFCAIDVVWECYVECE